METTIETLDWAGIVPGRGIAGRRGGDRSSARSVERELIAGPDSAVVLTFPEPFAASARR